jgi:hypothetical protein
LTVYFAAHLLGRQFDSGALGIESSAVFKHIPTVNDLHVKYPVIPEINSKRSWRHPMMKKTIALCAMTGFVSGVAHAQGSVRLYGFRITA